MKLWVAGLALMALLPVAPAAAEVRHAAVADFDGDGRSDLALLRPQGGWYIQPSGLACCWGFTWGYELNPDSRPVPGDYDGNLSTDPAMFSPSAGTWQVMPSNGTGAYIVPFGRTGDVPVPADYDGNGATDLAVYRPGDGTWHILRQPAVGLGQPGDIPVPGDYDGDGKADPAVFRPATGEWITPRGADTFGTAADTLVPADYDGDGRTDAAVYRDGSWSIKHSADGSVEARTLGAPGDLVAPADYDGDGRTDPAVYRPATGTWLIGTGQQVTLGGADDIPVAGSYLP